MDVDSEATRLRDRLAMLEQRASSIDEWRRFDVGVVGLMIRAQNRLLALQRDAIIQARLHGEGVAWFRAQAQVQSLMALIEELRATRLLVQGRILEAKAVADQRHLRQTENA